MEVNISELLDNLKINYKKTDVYVTALTHTSFIHEQKNKDEESYQRLEFLGDSILSFVVTNFLYRNNPNYDEGKMTLIRSHIINKDNLAIVGKKIGLIKYLRLGKGEKSNEISDSIYADAIESLIAAIFLDAGLAQVTQFIEDDVCYDYNNKALTNLKDHKTRLQEFLQADKGKSIKYELVEKINKNGVISFYVDAMFEGSVLGKGSGQSKKKAELNAAEEAYKKLIR